MRLCSLAFALLAALVASCGDVTLTATEDSVAFSEAELASKSVVIHQATPATLHARPSEQVRLTYRWSVRQASSAGRPLVNFIHFVNEAGVTAFQDDHWPAVPTTQWAVGDLAEDRDVVVPGNSPAGTYRVFAGLYDAGGAGARLKLRKGSGVTEDPSSKRRYQVATIVVDPGGSGGGPGGGAEGSGCAPWPDGSSLQQAVNDHACVRVAAGTFLVQRQLALPPGHTLVGSGMNATVIKADPAAFPIDGSHVVFAGSLVSSDLRNISDLTVDGSQVAVGGLCCSSFAAQRVRVVDNLCDGVDVNGPHVTISDSIIERSAWPATVPGRGSLSCAPPIWNGTYYGAGLYIPPGSDTSALQIVRTTIRDNNGPAIDCWGGSGGLLSQSFVDGNAGWAALHLYEGCSGWTIADSDVRHAPEGGFYPHTAECYPPSGPHGAAIRACKGSNNTTVVRSKLTSWYALISAGSSGTTIGGGNTMNGVVSIF